MTSELDSSSSSFVSISEQERKSKKLHKKLKKKSEKKLKKEKKKKSNKDKKRSHKEMKETFSDKGSIQMYSPILSQPKYEDINISEETDTFGPALPPHLLNKNTKFNKNEPLVIGPMIPMELLENLDKPGPQNLTEMSSYKKLNNFNKPENEINNLEGCYGPLPVTNELEMTSAQLALEQRALELKMAAIDGIKAPTGNQNVREEWMLELPNVGLKGGLAALNNLKRGFHQGKEKPDFSDRSSWTKTPNSAEAKQNHASLKAKQKIHAQVLYDKLRDAEQETIARKHKKKHKRDESLVEIHQKKLRKEEKKKAKELKESGAKPERRPFTRDVDLKLNKIDRNQTKQIVDKAKILNTKFSTGHSKYL